MVSWTAVYYTCYVIWLIVLMMDWASIERTLTRNSDAVFWGLVITIILLLLVFSILAGLYAGGRDITGLSGSTYAMIIGGLTVGLIGVIAFTYWVEWEQIQSIQNNLRVYAPIPIMYVHGRNSADIGGRLGLERSSVNPQAPISIAQMWDRIGQSKNPAKKVQKLNQNFLGQPFIGSDMEQYALFWYCCLSEDPTRCNLSRTQLQAVIKMTPTQQLELLGENYEGARDKASLLFAIMARQIIPNFTLSPDQRNRYDTIVEYPPGLVFSLAFRLENIIDPEQGTANIHPPHAFLSTRPFSTTEQLLLELKESNYEDYMTQYGLGRPFGTLNTKTFIIQTLCQYGRVFSRPPDLVQPPPLENVTPDQIRHDLSYYTNDELIRAYDPRMPWRHRDELIQIIIDDVTGAPRWGLPARYCTNDQTMNVITGELHGDTNKHDAEDPTISFGRHKNYVCYQASELEGSFRIYDGIFLFRIPDWTASSLQPSEFSLDSIKQLQALLEMFPSFTSLSPLRDKIRTGLDFYSSAQMQTLQIKRRYDSFTFEQQQLIQQYLAWMFMYAMWMRFWKGPGTPWPMRKVNVRRSTQRLLEQRASPQERDEHIFIQEGVRTALIESYETDPILNDWITTLPTIYYDFETTEARPATYPIKQTLDRIALGDHCMGFGSDTILKTAYYYIRTVLEKNKSHLFDEFITQMMPPLIDMEHHVITGQLDGVVRNGTRAQVLQERLHDIQQIIGGEGITQPSFMPSTYQNNIHID